MQSRTETRQESDLAMLELLMARGEIVPAQMPSASNWTAERRLAASILAGALVEIRDHAGERKYRRKIREDVEWIGSAEAEWPFSFLRLCELFGLDPAWVRGIVRLWLDAPNAGARRAFSTFRQAA